MDEPKFHRALFRPGTLIDVGAHSGSLTLALADLPWTRILAFEPLPSAFARLRQAVLAHWGRIPRACRPALRGARARRRHV